MEYLICVRAMLVFNNRIIDKSHMDLDTDIWYLVL